MPKTKTTTVYTFAELSDSAKTYAREQYRELEAQSGDTFFAESVLEDAVTIAGLLGITLSTRTVRLGNGTTRQEPVIHWSGFGSQGDGASFEGTYAYNIGTWAKIKAHAPKDEQLHAIAGVLQSVQSRHFYRITAQLYSRSSRYSHAEAIQIDVDRTDEIPVPMQDRDSIAEALRDFMRWIYTALEREYEYTLSDEVIDGYLEANEYEFDEDGRRA